MNRATNIFVITLFLGLFISTNADAQDGNGGLAGKLAATVGASINNISPAFGVRYYITDQISTRGAFSVGNNVTGLAAWILYNTPFKSGISLYGGPGFAAFKGPEESGPGYKVTTSGNGLIFTAGGELDLSDSITKNLHGFLEVDYYMFELKGKYDVNYWGFSDSGEVTSDFSSIQIAAGILYYF